MHPGPSPTTLHLDIRSAGSLLDIESSPLLIPRIHPDAAEALWTQAKSAGRKKIFRIEITAPAADAPRAPEVQAAIRSHFTREAEAATRELREIFRDGRNSAVLGLAIAAVLVVISEVLLAFGTRHISEAAGRALIILAWVALWHPADLLLYAHLPVRRRRKLAEALARAEVGFQPR